MARHILNTEELHNAIEIAGFGDSVATITRTILPSIRIRTQVVDEDTLSLGASKVGGLPDLPPDMEWPHWEGDPTADDVDVCGGPLCFLTQINLADCAVYDQRAELPQAGILYFFAAVWTSAIGAFASDFPCWQVAYWTGDTQQLKRTPVPPVSDRILREIYAKDHTVICSSITLSAKATLPNNGDQFPYECMNLNEDHVELYEALIQTLSREPNHPQIERRQPEHQMLGYPHDSHYDMRADVDAHIRGLDVPESELSTTDALKWRLLLQIDTDPQIGLCWQGWGRGYFWIHEDDLRVRDFRRVWLMMQCT